MATSNFDSVSEDMTEITKTARDAVGRVENKNACKDFKSSKKTKLRDIDLLF